MLDRIKKQRSNWGAGIRGIYSGTEHQAQNAKLLEALLSIHIIILQGNVPDILARRAVRNLVVIELEILRDHPDRNMIDSAYSSLVKLQDFNGITNLTEGLSPHLKILKEWHQALETE